MLDLESLRRRDDRRAFQSLKRSKERGERTHEQFISAAAALSDWLGTDWSENPFSLRSFTGADLVKHRGYQVKPAECWD